MKSQKKILDVIPDVFACHPTEIANRVHYMFTNTLLPMMFVPKRGNHVRIVPSAKGVCYINEPDELLLGRPV